jgi:hypothetical protein
MELWVVERLVREWAHVEAPDETAAERVSERIEDG